MKMGSTFTVRNQSLLRMKFEEMRKIVERLASADTNNSSDSRLRKLEWTGIYAFPANSNWGVRGEISWADSSAPRFRCLFVILSPLPF